MGFATIAKEKLHMNQDCKGRKYGHNNKNLWKQKNCWWNADELVPCLLTLKHKKENVKKKLWFVEDVKQPSDACVMCSINGDTFCLFTKNMWIRDSSASCHIMSNDTDLFDVINIDKSIQGSSSIMPTMKKGNLQVQVWKVDETEWVHTLWPIKFFPEACTNLFSLMCKLFQGISSQVTTRTTSRSVLQKTISSLIAKLRLTTAGLPELNSFKKHKTRGCNQLWPLARKMSTIHMLNNWIVSDMVAVDAAISALKGNRLVLKIMEELQDYLSCKIKIADDKKRA